MLLGAIAFVTGVTLMVLPEVADFAAPGADLLQVVGPIAGALGFVSMTEVTRALRRLNLLTAAAVAIGSFPVGLPPLGIAVVWVAAGILAVTALFGDGMPRDRYAGGWRALLD